MADKNTKIFVFPSTDPYCKFPNNLFEKGAHLERVNTGRFFCNISGLVFVVFEGEGGGGEYAPLYVYDRNIQKPDANCVNH